MTLQVVERELDVVAGTLVWVESAVAARAYWVEAAASGQEADMEISWATAGAQVQWGWRRSISIGSTPSAWAALTCNRTSGDKVTKKEKKLIKITTHARTAPSTAVIYFLTSYRLHEQRYKRCRSTEKKNRFWQATNIEREMQVIKLFHGVFFLSSIYYK